MTTDKSNSKATKDAVTESTAIPKEQQSKQKEDKDATVNIPQTEYDALINERDQLRANFYLIATQLKDIGFNVSEQGYGIQRLGTDVANKIRLSPKQMELIQKQIGSQ